MSGHIQRRGKASWRLKFEVDRDPVNGKRRIQYVTFRGTKKQAEGELFAYWRLAMPARSLSH